MKQTTRRTALITAAVLLVLGTVGIVSSTFAWLGVSRVPFVSDVDVSVMTESGLLIAPENEDGLPGKWDSTLDASAFLSGMAPLKPVTYTPEAFCKVVYDDTGRTNGVVPLEEKNFNSLIPADSSSAARAAAEEDGYMVAMPFWMTCSGSQANVCLLDAVETADGQMGPGTYVVGAPVWDSEKISHRNGGHGSEATIRMAFECTPTDMEGHVTGDTRFVIYEPNANLTLQGIDEDMTLETYAATQSVNGGELIDREHLIIQKASSWEEQDPIYEAAVVYQSGEFLQNCELFTLDGTHMMHVILYIWMEGQDTECIAAGVADAVSVAANLQFGAQDAEQLETGIGRR